MGRPRKTIEELKRSGTYRPSRHRDRAREASPPPFIPLDPPITPEPGEPGYQVGLPPPADLTGRARAWWASFSEALAGRIVASDAPQLARACRLLAAADECLAAGKDLQATSPEHGRAVRSALAFTAAADRLLADFALTPVARERLGVGAQHDDGIKRW